MKLREILIGTNIIDKVNFDENLEVESLTFDSRKASKNSLFFAIDGYNTDGRNYAKQSTENGAIVIVAEKKIENLNVCQIIVENSRKAMSLMSANFYHNAHKNLKIISIVGTNGKTTTSQIMAKILVSANKKVGVIGTNGIYIGSEKIEHDMTTPDPIKLHEIFEIMLLNKIEYVVMEVSAHAIFLDKMEGIKSESAIFTNFSQDHLDFFKTLENYKKVKKSFFDKKFIKSAVLNIDDEVGKELASELTLPIITYGIKNPSDIFAVNISMNLKGSEFVVNSFDDVFKINSSLTCLFNIYNILSCIACATSLGIKREVIIKGVKDIEKIDGRFNLVEKGQNFNVLIDYAHTPESLKNLLLNIKSLNNTMTILVFGCPGNRDELKREIMGKIAGTYADYVILTTDNPQFENSYRIMRDIERGVIKTKCPYKLVDDRSQAISLALSLANQKSNVVIAGKGIETYQNINGEHISYNDFEEVEKKLALIKKLKLESKFDYLK